MSHLQRVAAILGTLLVGIAAFLIASERSGHERSRRMKHPPVDELADDLKQAWAEHHHR